MPTTYDDGQTKIAIQLASGGGFTPIFFERKAYHNWLNRPAAASV